MLGVETADGQLGVGNTSIKIHSTNYIAAFTDAGVGRIKRLLQDTDSDGTRKHQS